MGPLSWGINGLTSQQADPMPNRMNSVPELWIAEKVHSLKLPVEPVTNFLSFFSLVGGHG